METRCRHAAGVPEPCAGWTLVQLDWSVRANVPDEPRRSLIGVMRRLLDVVLAARRDP
jgi:hypothetical protein